MSAIDELITELARLPGIGRQPAQRLTFHLLQQPPDFVGRLAAALVAVGERVRPCEQCGNLTEEQPCGICRDPRRDPTVLCVVEDASAVALVDRATDFEPELGEAVDPATLLPGVVPIARPEGGGLAAEVLWVDRFGNAQLNLGADDIDGWGDRVRLRLGETGVSLRQDGLERPGIDFEQHLTLPHWRTFLVAAPDQVSRDLRPNLRVDVAVERSDPLG